jgi:hypothetical protein
MLNREEREQLKKLKQKMLLEKQQKKLLINKNTDWGLLEQLIQRINENPELEVSVNLRDGTTLKLKTIKKQEIDPFV